MQPGLNLEFARAEGFDFEAGMRAAAEAGYRFVEPYVYAPIVLAINSHLSVQTVSPYHHLNTDTVAAAPINALRRALGVRFSALDAHSSLLLPQIGVPYLRRVLDLAADLECPLVMSDEGPLPADWLPLERGFDVFCASLDAVIHHARARGVRFAVELHNALTTRPAYLLRLLARFGPDDLSVNFDTGNSFLAGNDPVEHVRAVARRVAHVHIKDIPASQVTQRGKVTGTRVGVAVGDGVVDLPGVLAALAGADYDGVLSVECENLAQARTSLPALARLIGKTKSTGSGGPSTAPASLAPSGAGPGA